MSALNKHIFSLVYISFEMVGNDKIVLQMYRLGYVKCVLMDLCFGTFIPKFDQN